MSIVRQSLFAVAILSVALVEAAPMDSKAAKQQQKGGGAAKKNIVAPRRGKRNVVVEEMPMEMVEMLGKNIDYQIEKELEEAVEEDVLREQLSDLTDDQLEMLSEIVQNEIDRYDPDIGEYEIVELPEYLTQSMELYPRDRRSLPPVVFEPYSEYDIPENIDTNEMVFIPEEALLEAAAEEQAQQTDELEIRQRIAEIASILNERATRRLRFV